MSNVEIVLLGVFLGTVLASVAYCGWHFYRYRPLAQKVERDS
ncbi:hypothetical protein JCM13664_00580 [Methylothermus subterraneus]